MGTGGNTVFNKVVFFISSFLVLIACGVYIASMFGSELIYVREPVLGVFGSIYYLLSGLLMLWGMYRGAFRIFLSRTVTNLIVINTLFSAFFGVYDEFRGVLDSVTRGELLRYLAWIICANALSIKVILAARKKTNQFDDIYIYTVRNLEQNLDNDVPFDHQDIQDAIVILEKLPPFWGRGSFKRAYLQNNESLRKLPKNPEDLLKRHTW